MNIQTLTLGPLATNCYLVRADESSRAVIIDPAANSKRLLAALEEQGLTLEAILLTHAHFDHIGALKNLRAATNARVYIGEADKDDPSHMCHDLLTYTDTYQDGDTVAAGGLTFQVLCYARPHAGLRVPAVRNRALFRRYALRRLLWPDRLPRRKQPGHGRVFEAAVHAAA